MTARRSASLIPAQPAISASVRPQPTQRPVSLSSRQILTHGVSKKGFARLLVPSECRDGRGPGQLREWDEQTCALLSATHARPGCEGGWRAEKRKILWLVPCGTRAPRGAPNRGRLRQRALLSSGPSRSNTPTEPSASSWQGLLVVPEGAPLPPGCLVATRPAGAAPRPAFATPRESAP